MVFFCLGQWPFADTGPLNLYEQINRRMFSTFANWVSSLLCDDFLKTAPGAVFLSQVILYGVESLGGSLGHSAQTQMASDNKALNAGSAIVAFDHSPYDPLCTHQQRLWFMR